MAARRDSKSGWRFVLVAGMALAALAGCDRPCKRLADQLCSRNANDDAACERWKERIARVSPETCETGLRLLDRERVQ